MSRTATPAPGKGQPYAERPEVEVAGQARKEDRMAGIGVQKEERRVFGSAETGIRTAIVRETLSDGSKVFNATYLDAERQMEFGCGSYAHALHLAQALAQVAWSDVQDLPV